LEESFEHYEQSQALRSAISQLPLRRQQVLRHFLVGESVTNIATILNISADLVRQDKHRGLAILQRLGLYN
jgi:RNA polymerase sigma factor (sigma-70 family)